MSVEACPECGKQPTTERVPAGMWVTTCDDCCGLGFPAGIGSTAGAAENDWDEEVADWRWWKEEAVIP